MTDVQPTETFDSELSLMEALLVLRARHGWTQESVAKSLLVPLRTLRSWEQGTRNPSGDAGLTLTDFVRRYI